MKVSKPFLAATLFLTSGSLRGQLQPPNVQATDHVGAVAITLTRFGPNPATITRAQGPFLLFIVNRSGVLEDTFSLVLKPAAGALPGASLLDLHSTLSAQRDFQLIRPLPGNYQIRFLAHPSWVVDITITTN